MTEQDDRQELLAIFLTEATERIAHITAALHPADGSQPTPDAVREQYVMAHNLHGSALLCGFPGVGGLAAILETTLEEVGQVPEAEWSGVVTMMRD